MSDTPDLSVLKKMTPDQIMDLSLDTLWELRDRQMFDIDFKRALPDALTRRIEGSDTRALHPIELDPMVHFQRVENALRDGNLSSAAKRLINMESPLNHAHLPERADCIGRFQALASKVIPMLADQGEYALVEKLTTLVAKGNAQAKTMGFRVEDAVGPLLTAAERMVETDSGLNLRSAFNIFSQVKSGTPAFDQSNQERATAGIARLKPYVEDPYGRAAFLKDNPQLKR